MKDFEIGEELTYVPGFANGDINDPACEQGVVSSVSGTGESQKVWVRYTGGETGALTPIKNLVRR